MITCFVKVTKSYSSLPKLGKWYYIIVIFLKENSYKLFSNCVYSKFVHFNLEMFPDDPLPNHYSKTTGHVTVDFFFKKSVLVSNIIIKILETFRFWIQILILIETGIFSHSKSSVHRPIFVCVISFYCRVVWHRFCQFKLKSGPIIIIPASKNICLKRNHVLRKWQVPTYGVKSKNSIRYTSTSHRSSIVLLSFDFPIRTLLDVR